MQLFAIVLERRPEHISTIVLVDMTLHDVTVSGLFRGPVTATNDSIPINQRQDQLKEGGRFDRSIETSHSYCTQITIKMLTVHNVSSSLKKNFFSF